MAFSPADCEADPTGETFCGYGVSESKQKYTMNKLEIEGEWNITKGMLKQKWAKLTDSDLQFVDGKHDELLGRIQKRTGETRKAIEKVIQAASS